MGVPGHYATRIEYRIVLAVMPFPARPMEAITGLERSGTFTSTTSML